MSTTTSFFERISPEELAQRLGTFPPTPEQAKVIRGGRLTADSIVEGGLDPMLVIAGAGSGKTQTMADRVVYLVANLVVRPDEILGVTFTNKAAGELKTRVTGQLMQLIYKQVISAEEILTGEAYPEEEAVERRRAASTSGLEDLLSPSVSTYHSYANTLVRRFGVRIGVEPESIQLSEAHSFQIASAMIQQLTTPETQDQDQSEDQDHNDIQWVGGFNTSEVVQALIDSEESPAALAKDVLSMDSQLSEHLKTPADVSQWVTDYLARAEASFGESAPSSPKYVSTLVQKIQHRRVIAALVGRFRELKRDGGYLDFGDLLATGARIAEEPEVQAAEQQQYKVVLLDEFQDTSHAQLEIFHRLYSGGHCVTAVGDPNQSIYGFRGASAGQLFVFPEQFRTQDGRPANRRLLTVAWRNKPKILEVANAVVTPFTWDPRPEAKPGERMGRPWHEGMRVQLGAITREIIAEAEQALAAAEETGNQAAISAQRAELERLKEHGLQLRPSPAGVGNTTEEVVIRFEADAVAESQALADELEAAYRRRGADIRDAGSTSSKPVTGAVLATKRNLLAPLAAELHARKIPYEFVGLAGLLSTPEVREALSWVQVLADPEQNDATLRILSGEQLRLGPKDLYLLGQDLRQANRPLRGTAAETAEHATLLEIALRAGHPEGEEKLGLSPAATQRLAWLAEVIDTLSAEVSSRPAALLEKIINTIGLQSELEVATAGRSTAGHQLRMLIDYADQFEAEHASSSLRGFLAWLDAAEIHEKGLRLAEVMPNPHAVQLMTMHAAKGLEWNVVAVMGMQEGTLPDTTSISDRWTADDGAVPAPMRGDADSLPTWSGLSQADWKAWAKAEGSKEDDIVTGEPYQLALRAYREEEQRRLAYVAVTRAEDDLILTGSRFVGTNKTAREPSRYLVEAAAAVKADPQLAAQITQAETQEANAAASTYLISQWPYEHLDGPEVYRQVRDPETEEVIETEPLSQPVPQEALPSTVVRQAADLVTGQRQAPTASADTTDSQVQQWQQEVDFVLGRQRVAGQSSGATEPTLTAHQLTATHLVGLAESPERVIKQLQRPIPQQPRAALRRGTAVHAWLEERFGSVDKALPGFEEMGFDAALVETFQLEAIRERFTAETNPWADRAAFDVELSFAVPLAGRTIRGQIDAIFGVGADGRELTAEDRRRWYGLSTAARNEQMQRCAWQLVDWKTGRAPRGRENLEHKLIQLAVYKQAFTSIFGVSREQVEVSLYYLEEDDPQRRLVTHPSPQLAEAGVRFRDSAKDLEEILAIP